MVTSADFGKGFYDWETQDIIPFHWLSQEGELLARLSGSADPRCLLVVVRHFFAGMPAPALEVLVDGRSIGRAEVPGEFQTLLFPFRGGGDTAFTFRLDRFYHAPGDDRSLGIMVRKAVVLSVNELEDPEYGSGWYDGEQDDLVSFRWMGGRSDIVLPARHVRSHRYLDFPIFSDFYDSSQTLTLTYRGRVLAEWPLIRGWGHYCLDLADLKEAAHPEGDNAPLLELRLNKLYPSRYHAADGRQLGARVGLLEFHDNQEWHEDSRFFRDNGRLSYEEMKAGKTVLRSYPLSLGIDLFGRCNISPPCVYCLWDRMKEMEGGHADDVVDDRTLRSYGPFFRSTRLLVNCSFGEPLLHPRLAEILELAAKTKKTVELSTNGQALPAAVGNDLGQAGLPLCREPWESYYILRRGIMPCCYGNPIIGQMPEYAEVWNSPELQEIRPYLSQGRLSPYCLKSPGCPIVQRVLAEAVNRPEVSAPRISRDQKFLRVINRLLFGVRGRIQRTWKRG